ncbi:hypothetical protein [Sphingomonas sp. SRS2]|uniref:hypothetical protein n=1 Tax=Sphingomonas sp. SRS2 TaxID=133190 RepID=UPI00061848A4|nr:hypothetical protein [Sphingomonas sp. SRS2]KKC24776.1 hypothetical protein WP12_17420 [Sphingomonas sp. SRS2]
MNDVDDLLGGLRDTAADPRLDDIGAAVMAGAAAQRARRVGRRSLVLAGVLAMSVGVITSLASPQRAQAEQTVALNAIPANAPSSLLLGAR